MDIAETTDVHWKAVSLLFNSLVSSVASTVREFLSDAPFFRLSLWTEFKLTNCACASGWSCLMNLDLRSKFVHF